MRIFTLASKLFSLSIVSHAWDHDARPQHLRGALEGSLVRLKLECVDLYKLHAPDPRVPFAESVGCLADLQRAGKIRHLGLSNVSVAQLEQARRIAPIVSVQNRYSLEDRGSEDVLAACERSIEITFNLKIKNSSG